MLVTIDMHCHHPTQSQTLQTGATRGQPRNIVNEETPDSGREKFKFIF